MRQIRNVTAAALVAAVLAVVAIKADSTVAILDGGMNNIGTIELSSYDFSLCEHQGFGTTTHRKLNHPWFWDCSNGYHLTE